jgi:hypothetical protein
MSINDHINIFTKLHTDVKYHAPPDTKPMSNAQINLAFLCSFGRKFEMFQQAMGDQTYKLKPGELFARVRAFIDSKDEPDEKEKEKEKAPEGAKSLSLRISDDNG